MCATFKSISLVGKDAFSFGNSDRGTTKNTIENCKEMGDGLCCAVNGTDLVLVAFFGRENGPLFSAKKSPKKGMIYDTQKRLLLGCHSVS